MIGGEDNLFAVIDLGSHSVKMEIAQLTNNGSFRTIETLTQLIPIGKDVFTVGRIKSANFSLASKIFKDFAHVLNEYGIVGDRIRAVATSAVREAANKDIFIDRIQNDSGIRIEVLESAEEIRIVYLSLKKLFQESIDSSKDFLIFIIGTGSSHLCLVRDGRLRKAESFRMGTIRIYEELEQPLGRKPEFLDDIVDSVVGLFTLTFENIPKTIIAAGASPRALLSLVKKANYKGLEVLEKEQFFSAVKTIENSSPDILAKEYDISDIDALGLLPCCEVLSHLLDLTRAPNIMVAETTTRDAIFEDMLRENFLDDPFEPEILSCAEALGEKFNYDRLHAQTVAKYSIELFDSLKKIHGLGKRDRLLLNVSAILHDVGQFLNNRQHHKHSFYLISNSQLPGLSSIEHEMIAVIARYHRRGLPKTSHPEYMQFEPAERVKISKLAAILRVADALDRSHNAKFDSLNISFDGDKILFEPNSKSPDFTAEILALKSKSDLFSETYGIKPEFKQ